MLKKCKVRLPLESDLCEAFVRMFEYLQKCNQFRKRMYLIHIANEQGRNKINYTKKLKRMGLKKGVADYCIMIEGGRVAFIEFKRHSKSDVSDAQRNFGDLCISFCTPYLLTWSVDDAIEWVRRL